jgi:hypothetical protein
MTLAGKNTMENPRTHFGFSSLIDIRRLERPARRLLFLGFLFAVLFHGLLSFFVTFKAPYQRVKPFVEKPEKPIRMDIIVIPPRNLKPFSVSERRFERKTVRPAKPSGEISMPGIEVKTPQQFGDMKTHDSFRPEPPQLLIPEMKSDMDQNLAFKDSMVYIERPERIPSNLISMRDEMLTIEDLDYGRYQGLLIENPQNKLSLRGIIEIPYVYLEEIAPYHVADVLVECVKTFTNNSLIAKNVKMPFGLSSPRLMKYPFIYIAADSSFELTSWEKKNFGNYLRNGGFAVLENALPWDEFPPAEASLRQMIKDSLGPRAKLERIPMDHDLFHCFFDFNLLPAGAEHPFPEDPRLKRLIRNPILNPVEYIEGVWIDGRLAAVYSDKGYCLRFPAGSGGRQRQLGVNMVVFALKQKGGITVQKTDYSLEAEQTTRWWGEGDKKDYVKAIPQTDF